MSDLLPATATPVPPVDAGPDGAPFVRVLIDRDNRRAIIALDAAAIGALIDIIDAGAPHDLSLDPGVYGISQDQADTMAHVAGQLHGPLLKVLGYL